MLHLRLVGEEDVLRKLVPRTWEERFILLSYGPVNC